MTVEIGTKLRGYCLTEYGKAMVEEHLELTSYAVRWLDRDWHSHRGDLGQVAYEGLIDAVAHYNPNMDVKFPSYAPRRIRGTMQDYLRSTHLMTPYRDGRKVKVDDRPAVQTIHTKYYRTLYSDPDTSHFGGDGYHPIPDRAPPPGAAMEADENFEAWLRGLTEDEKFVMREYYSSNPKTMKQIGYHLELTEGRVSQIHETALDQLRYRATFPKYRQLATA